MPSLSSWMTFAKEAFALQTIFILKYYSVLKLRNLSIKDFTNWTLPKSSWGAFKNWPFVLQACTTISYHTIALSFSRGRRLPSPPDPRLLPQPRPRHGAQARPPTHSLRRSAPPDPQSTWVPPTPTAVRVPGVRRVVPCRVTVSLGPVEHSSISSQDPPPHTLSLEWTSTCWWPSMRPELGVRLRKGICVASVYLFPSSEKTSRLFCIFERESPMRQTADATTSSQEKAISDSLDTRPRRATDQMVNGNAAEQKWWKRYLPAARSPPKSSSTDDLKKVPYSVINTKASVRRLSVTECPRSHASATS